MRQAMKKASCSTFVALATGLGTIGVSSTALAGDAGFVVWMEGNLPSEDVLKRSDRKTGPARHMAHVDLAFPPQPESDEDGARLDALKTAIATGKTRWDEFDVEYGIAVDVGAALDAIDVVRDERDRQDLTDALLFQGAAISKAFDPASFLSDESAEPFRVTVGDTIAIRPWLYAAGLEPEREFTRADVADGSAYPQLQELVKVVAESERATIDLSSLPGGANLVVDGRAIDSGTEKLVLPPGRHYLHVMRGDVIAGRQILEVGSGKEVAPPLVVDAEELAAAEAQVLAGTTAGLPEDVKGALDALAAFHDGPIFIAAMDEKGRIEVLPYARDAKLLKKRPVTIVGTGELGGGAIISPLFDGSEGKNVTAPTVMGSLGLEIGIFNFALLGGCDLAFAPTRTVTHGNSEEPPTDNVSTSVMPMPWGGVGAYILRPTGLTPTLLLAGTYGWTFPAHMGFGGRIALGIPVDKQGTWFRLSLGGSGSAKPMQKWVDAGFDDPMYTLFMRFGLAARF